MLKLFFFIFIIIFISLINHITIRPSHPNHYSIRILPHHQDTGGFFVALFRKKAVETLPKQVAAVETAEQLAEEETEVEAVDKKAAVDDEGEKMIGDSGEKKRKSGGDDGYVQVGWFFYHCFLLEFVSLLLSI